MKKWIQQLIRKAGYDLVRRNLNGLQEFQHEKEFLELYALCRPYTMTSPERMFALYQSVQYILDRNLKGCFVECGVWRGGSAMLIAKMLQNRKITDRKIYLFDTFEGMSTPTNNDVDFRGRAADVLLEQNEDQKETSVWCLADLQDVRRNMQLTNYADVIYVQGKVEETLPSQIPAEEIALLRLDTDWYESTKHELEQLYPRLIQEGILIIDDYGHWEGCRKAVDEYFANSKHPLLLHRIDYTGRVAVKM